MRGGKIKIYSIIVRAPPNFGGRAAVPSRRDTSKGGSDQLPEDSRAAEFIPWLSILFPAMRRLRTAALPQVPAMPGLSTGPRKTSYCSVTAPQSNPADSNRPEILLHRGAASRLMAPSC